jgi:hypothetical protein
VIIEPQLENLMSETPDAITPRGYGLMETTTLKLAPTLYVRPEVAAQAAARMTNRFKAYVAIPLFGPEAYDSLKGALEASQHAESTLRSEAIHLRNEAAQRRGLAVASAHAAGRPAP